MLPLLFVSILLGATEIRGQVAATAIQRRVHLTPCRIPEIEGEMRCGTYEVFENRTTRRGRTISLRIVQLPALTTSPAPDALFILAGGPGQAASDNAEFFSQIFAQVRRERDIVLVDQRGTGGSNLLRCDLYGDTLQGHLGDLLPLEAIRICRLEWEKHADLHFYTTSIAMDDLDEVRAAMGYPQINLFGTSYGTRAAQDYMRRYPSRVRSVVIKGVTPITEPLTLSMARDAQRSIDLLFDDCAADGPCHAAFPELRQEFRKVLARLEQDPVKVEVPDGTTGQRQQVVISKGAVTPTLRSMLQAIGSAAQIPMLIHRAFENDYAPLARATLAIRRPFPKLVSTGVFLLVPTAEDLPVSDSRRIARESHDTFLGDYYFRQLQQAGALLPRGPVPAGFRSPVRSKIPTLLISGFLDPATPPSGADKVARYLANSLHVVIRNGSHSYSGLSPCVDNVMAAFISNASVKGLDTSCVDQVRRPPFVLGASEK